MSLDTHIPARFDSSNIVDPASVSPENFTITGPDATARGRNRGEQAAEGIARTFEAYSALFTAKGIDTAAQERGAQQSLEALRAWDESQYRELEGVAAGAGLELWQVGLVNGRTEILTLADVEPHECSTLANRDAAAGTAYSVQTWDWHVEFADVWHYHSVEGTEGRRSYAGFAEYGMLGKIGMNDAGVAVHLNILKNAADHAGGVPVHSILAGVLARAGSVQEAIDLVLSAETTSSSVITVTGADRIVMIEIGPQHKQVIEIDGWGVHTNHFIGDEMMDGALELKPVGSTSQARYALLQERVSTAEAPAGTADFLPLMSTSGDEAPVCCVIDPAKPFGERTGTLVTVQFDPAAKVARMSPGNPKDVPHVATTEFSFA
ncbi:C45 family peptidase [Brevibacterium samyangense]|uniref:C45 family autoproteolytic acyltransferase/hydolase n=1 Tax=Brevibacterium samyangense TaxID=366888 RepID=A0ABN2T5Z0_9MICO